MWLYRRKAGLVVHLGLLLLAGPPSTLCIQSTIMSGTTIDALPYYDKQASDPGRCDIVDVDANLYSCQGPGPGTD